MTFSVVDPYVFEPPGSGSVIICTDPDPSIIKQTYNNKKNLDFYCFCDFFMTFLFLKNDVNVLSKSNK